MYIHSVSSSGPREPLLSPNGCADHNHLCGNRREFEASSNNARHRASRSTNSLVRASAELSGETDRRERAERAPTAVRRDRAITPVESLKTVHCRGSFSPFSSLWSRARDSYSRYMMQAGLWNLVATTLRVSRDGEEEAHSTRITDDPTSDGLRRPGRTIFPPGRSLS